MHHGLTRPFSTSDLTARSIATWTRAGRRCDALSLRTCSWRTENLGFARARQNTDRSQLGTASKMCITDFIHSSEASTPDNGNKGEVPIHFSIDENDNVVYVMHERRRYVDGWSVILERFVASDAWVVIQALWPNLNFKANNARRSRVPKRRWSPTGNCSRSVRVGAQRARVSQTRRHVEYAVNLSLTCTSTIMIATSGTRLRKSVKCVFLLMDAT